MLLSERFNPISNPVLTQHYGFQHHSMSTPDDPVMHSPRDSSSSIEASMNIDDMNLPNMMADREHRLETPTSQRSGSGGSGGDCDSPTESIDDNDSEGRRRAKLCRVCSDHATGYNFNVITCESCKAFFRRNALRPKEFKCPYADDCEINAVSRRFCQKCRLRKCFTVGMKKEWILNDEQLRRRKNSRLNSNLSTDGDSGDNRDSGISRSSRSGSSRSGNGRHHHHCKQQSSSPTAKTPQKVTPLTIMTPPVDTPPPSGASARRQSFGGTIQRAPRKMDSPLVSPTTRQNAASLLNNHVSQQQTNPQLLSPVTTVSPIISRRDSPESPTVHHRASLNATTMDGEYDPNCLQMQRQMLGAQQQNSGRSNTTSMMQKQQYDGNEIITMTRQDLEKLIQQAAKKGGVLPTDTVNSGAFSPPPKRMAYGNCNGEMSSATMKNGGQMLFNGFPMMQQENNSQWQQVNGIEMQQMDGASEYQQQMSQAPQMSSFQQQPPVMSQQMMFMQERFQQNMHDTIHHALNINSPEANEGDTLQEIMDGGDPRLNFQLNTKETRELELVRDAFAVLNEKVEGKSADLLMKSDHKPADILNIMDITMRRLVKVAKKMPAFNDLSADTKFALLKGGMVEMLTMRGVRRFDMKSQSWKTPVVNERYHVSFSMFDQLRDDIKDMQKDAFLGIMESLNDDVRVDELAIDLIVLVVLFDTSRPGVNNPNDIKIIEQHRECYLNLLLRYLQATYGSDAAHRYDGFKNLLERLKQIGKHASNLFLGTVRPEDAEPLAKEFFKTE